MPVAQKSSEDLWQRFIEFEKQNDFVGMDMTRKFIQMGFVSENDYRLPRPLADITL